MLRKAHNIVEAQKPSLYSQMINKQSISKTNCTNIMYFVLIAVTGNANFNMSRTLFSFFGMTQPYAAMPVIQDQSNNAKGFTSRILWFFPEPVFAEFDDTMLTPKETTIAQEFEDELGINTYIDSITTYCYCFYKLPRITINTKAYSNKTNAIIYRHNLQQQNINIRYVNIFSDLPGQPLLSW